MRTIGLISAAVLTLFYCAPASADGNVCNNTCSTIFTTFGEISSDPSQSWVEGWWHVQPGQCVSPIIGDVCGWWANLWGNCPDFVVMRAQDSAGHQWFGSPSIPICTTNSHFDETPQLGACPAGQTLKPWFLFNSSGDSDVTFNLPCP
jgi:uncharacterized membrane protein